MPASVVPVRPLETCARSSEGEEDEAEGERAQGSDEGPNEGQGKEGQDGRYGRMREEATGSELEAGEGGRR